jgi:uncharacterized membrane protein YdjX (TVP38/TMEM64 family)
VAGAARPAAVDPEGRVKRPLLLIGCVAAVIIILNVLVENVFGIQLEPQVRTWLVDPGAGTALTIVALLVADIALPIPSSVVMVLSGAAFGVLGGSVVALIGSIGGEWLGFELVRRYGRNASQWLVGDVEVDRLARIFKRHGAVAVAVTRALPVVMETMSIVAGLSYMKRRDFLVASFVGTVPIVLVYAYAGALSRETGNLVPALVMLIAVAGFGWVLYRARLSAD